MVVIRVDRRKRLFPLLVRDPAEREDSAAFLEQKPPDSRLVIVAEHPQVLIDALFQLVGGRIDTSDERFRLDGGEPSVSAASRPESPRKHLPVDGHGHWRVLLLGQLVLGDERELSLLRVDGVHGLGAPEVSAGQSGASRVPAASVNPLFSDPWLHAASQPRTALRTSHAPHVPNALNTQLTILFLTPVRLLPPPPASRTVESSVHAMA